MTPTLRKICFGFGTLLVFCTLVCMFWYNTNSLSNIHVQFPRAVAQEEFVMAGVVEIATVTSVHANGRHHSPMSHTGHRKRDLKKRFPNAIIIGVKKGGTRALIEMLRSHPLIKGPTIEPQFFSFHFENGLKWYIDLMPLTKENELTIEKSPDYFNMRLAPERLYNVTSDKIKLILVVRHPITRAISDYVHFLNNVGNATMYSSFEKKVILNGTVNSHTSEINKSMYDVHYERWLKWFKKEQILIVNGEELITHPVTELSKVEAFLNLSHYFTKEMFIFNKEKGFYCWKTLNGRTNRAKTRMKCLGSSKGREHPTVSEDTLDKIRKFLKPHAERFCSLAAVNFSWCSL